MRGLRIVGGLVLAVSLAGCGSEEGKALCQAVWDEDLEAVESLLARPTDPNEHVTFHGHLSSPWRVAVDKLGLPNEQREAIALAVLEAGGDPDLSWGNTPPGEASETIHTYALEVPAGGGSTRVVEAMIRAGARVREEPGGEALVAAARSGQVEVLELLLDAGAPLDFKSQSGRTALGEAVDAVNREAIALLEARGATEW